MSPRSGLVSAGWQGIPVPGSTYGLYTSPSSPCINPQPPHDVLASWWERCRDHVWIFGLLSISSLCVAEGGKLLNLEYFIPANWSAVLLIVIFHLALKLGYIHLAAINTQPLALVWNRVLGHLWEVWSWIPGYLWKSASISMSLKDQAFISSPWHCLFSFLPEDTNLVCWSLPPAH